MNITKAASRLIGKLSWLALGFLVLTIVGGGGCAVAWWLGRLTHNEVVAECQVDTLLLALSLSSHISSLEKTAHMMSKAPSLRAALKDDHVPNPLDESNITLDNYCAGYRASVCYLLNSRGTVIASSNRGDQDSFVGNDYSCHPYFTQTLEKGSARCFARGVNSSAPGFYVASAIRDEHEALLGVVVIKIDIYDMCSLFLKHKAAFLLDFNGVVLASSRPEWVFHALRPKGKSADSSSADKQPENSIPPLAAVNIDDFQNNGFGTFEGKRCHVEALPIGPDGWTLVLFADLQRVGANRVVGLAVTLLLVLLILSFLVIIRLHERARATLQESEEKYRRLIETTNTGYLIMDTKGRILDANKEYARLAGHNEFSEIAGRSVLEWTAEHDRKKNIDALDQCLKDGQIRNLVVDHVDSRGQLIPVEINATIIGENGPQRVIALCRDITERKRAEMALKESEETFRMHVNNSFDVIFTLDKNGTFIFISPAWERHFGIPVKDALGKNFALFMHPDDIGPCLEYLHRVMSTKTGGVSPPYRVKCADGGWSWFETNGTPYVDLNGELRFIGSGRDINKRKETDEALRGQMALLRTMMDGIPDIIGLMHPDHTMIAYNEAGYKFLGKSHAEVEGRKCYELIGQASLCDNCPTAKAIDSGRVVIKEKFLPDKGVWLENRSIPVFDESGKIHLIVEILRDITVRKTVRRGSAARESGGRGRQQDEERVSGQCEPRDTHASERGDRIRRDLAGHTSERGPDQWASDHQSPKHGPRLHHQRHPGSGEDRVWTHGDLLLRVQPPSFNRGGD